MQMEKADSWLVVMTKPRMEKEACEHLTRQQFEVYLPYWSDMKKQRGDWRATKSPMFPRYLFIRPLFADQSISSVRSTRGVSQLVRFGSEPARAPNSLINDIRLLEQNASKTDLTLTPFNKGDLVQVVDGPFQGVSAEVLSCDQHRVVLLLQLLGKKQSLTFKTNACSAVI